MSDTHTEIRCDGAAIKRLRIQHAMTQEKLGMMSNVSLRTIQRAEKNMPLALETVAGIASALKTTVGELTLADTANDNADSFDIDDSNAVVLRPIKSGKVLLDMVLESYSGKQFCRAEPIPENVDVLTAVVERIEKLMPNPWESPFEGEAFSLADRLRGAVELTSQLKTLEKQGITVFAGTFTAKAQIPRWDSDEGFMCTNVGQKYEPVTICHVVFDKFGANRVVTKVDDQWAAPRSSPTFDLSDEIPF